MADSNHKAASGTSGSDPTASPIHEKGEVSKPLRFVPLENNPEVMSSLVHNLGLSPELSWHDVYSLDDPSLLAFVPRPAHALLLVFPTSSAYEKARLDEDSSLPDYAGTGSAEEVLWFKQTIGNACGLVRYLFDSFTVSEAYFGRFASQLRLETYALFSIEAKADSEIIQMGLIHATCNGMTRELIAPATPLSTLITEALPLDPRSRATLIEINEDLATAHASAAAGGDTAAPPADDKVDLHYVAFVKSERNNLWELDGGRKGPLNRGEIGDGDDVLCEKAIQLGPKRFLKREEEAGGGEMRFSILALGPSLG